MRQPLTEKSSDRGCKSATYDFTRAIKPNLQRAGRPPFTGMKLDDLIPETLPQDTGVLFRALNSLEYRPERLILFATDDGLVTEWYCG